VSKVETEKPALSLVEGAEVRAFDCDFGILPCKGCTTKPGVSAAPPRETVGCVQSQPCMGCTIWRTAVEPLQGSRIYGELVPGVARRNAADPGLWSATPAALGRNSGPTLLDMLKVKLHTDAQH
jgi:hypothetical protein